MLKNPYVTTEGNSTPTVGGSIAPTHTKIIYYFTIVIINESF